MKVEVAYTAQLRVRTGTASEPFELEAGASVGDLLTAIASKYEIEDFLNGCLLCFVGASQVDVTHPLAEGDPVTLLTPISGG